MKSLLSLIVLSALITFTSCKNNEEPSDLTLSESEIENTPLATDFMYMQRAFPFNKIKTNALKEALEWRNSQKKDSWNSDAVWEQLGPTNVGGRITDIEIPVDDANTYYAGAATGGIFKTTDAGKTWVPIFDDQPFISIGDMEISKKDTNLIWAGTGEANSSGDTMTYTGDCIFKSTDAGVTWESKGLENIAGVGKIIIDPTNDNTVFVAATGHLYNESEERGVYRTKDGGDTWEKILYINDKTGAIDMAIHPTNGNIIYAATWERIRKVGMKSQFGGEGTNIYKSEDGGDTWKKLTNGLPSNASDKGRIGLDIAQSNPDVLYARYATAKGKVQGVYKTSNGGDSWEKKNSSQITDSGFHWWFSGIFVDPKNENTIYNVDFEVHKSTNGGSSWSKTFSGAHVDMHALAFNAKKPGHVLLGCDGGVYSSDNGGASPSKFTTLPLTQFYRIYVDPSDYRHVIGGTQDNSTPRTKTGGLKNWRVLHSGDGFQPLIDPENNIIYAQSQNGALVKSTNGGSSFRNATSGIASGDRNNWNSPVTFDPKNYKTLYFGTQRVYKSTNSAGSWKAISGDLSNGGVPGGSSRYGNIYYIDVSPIDSNIIYAGTDDGNVWVTRDGSNWTKISDDLPKRWVTKVYADREDKATAYVTLSGHYYSEYKGHIFKTTDYGETWEAIGTTLPDAPINDIMKDKFGNLFVGSDLGVFGSNNEGKSWHIVGSNLPSVKIADMHMHKDQYLYAGTYGRSIYRIDISKNILDTDNTSFEANTEMYPNPASNKVTFNINKLTKRLSVIIYDPLGREVYKQSKNNTKSITIPVNTINNGNYFATIHDGKNTVTKKLIIK